MTIPPVPPALLERLRDLALVDVDTVVGPLEGSAAAEVVAAFVADLEDVLQRARAVIRDTFAALAAGPDPLDLADRGSELRTRGGEPAIEQSSRRLAERASARRALALLEELCRGVLPRLLEADRRLQALGRPG